MDIPRPQVTAECEIEKFTKYVFSQKYKNNGKMKLFLSWGYDTIDAQYLVEEFIRQAEEKYANGDFILEVLNEYGQRISIIIEIMRRDGNGIARFLTGWMVYPDGYIKLTTPFEGEVK